MTEIEAALCRLFQPVSKGPAQFVRATRVLPLMTSHLEPRVADLAEGLARPEIQRALDEAPRGG